MIRALKLLFTLLVFIICSGSVLANTWGDGMTFYGHYIAEIKWRTDGDEFLYSQSYSGDNYMSSSAYSSFYTELTTVFESGTGIIECHEPYVPSQPSSLFAFEHTAMYTFTNDECDSGASGGVVVLQDYMICPDGYYPNFDDNTCDFLFTPPTCDDYIGEKKYVWAEEKLVLNNRTCTNMYETGLTCAIEPIYPDSSDITYVVANSIEAVFDSISGKEYEIVGDCNDSETPPADELPPDELDEFNCITGEGGQSLCLDEDGGSDMVASDDEGHEITAPNNSICTTVNGTWTCFEITEDGQGCGYVNGVYDCFDSNGEPIDDSSPDHPDNGGNADGEDTNDPLDPTDPTDTLSDSEQVAADSEAIGEAVGKSVSDALGEYLDGDLDDDTLQSIDESLTGGLPVDPDTGELLSQDSQAADVIDSLTDFTTLIDATDEGNRIKSAVSGALSFTDPNCSNYSESLFSGTGLGSIDIDISCSQTSTMREFLKYALWLSLVVYLFMRITSFKTTGD